MWLNTDSPVDILLHPVFLKYLGICVLLAAMLDEGGRDAGALDSQQAALLWLLVGFEALVWLGLAFFLLKKLAKRGYITGVYSPIILAPILVISEFLTYQVASSFAGGPLDVNLFLSDLFRDAVLLVLFDVIFSSYVVHQHPAFSKTMVTLPRHQVEPSRLPETTGVTLANAPIPVEIETPAIIPKEQVIPARIEKPRPVAEELPNRANEVQIGGTLFSVDEILMLRSEDHYLTVLTASRKVLVRARLSDTVAKLDLRYGVQINRSVWVAFAGIDRLRKTPKGLQVYMRDGSEETVATVRRHAVRSAFELYQMREK